MFDDFLIRTPMFVCRLRRNRANSILYIFSSRGARSCRLSFTMDTMWTI